MQKIIDEGGNRDQHGLPRGPGGNGDELKGPRRTRDSRSNHSRLCRSCRSRDASNGISRGDSVETATLETIQAQIDNLKGVVDAGIANLKQVVDMVRLNTEAIAKNENERRQENTEVLRRLDSLRVNTEAIAKNENELRQENTELRILAEAGFLRFAVRVDAEDFQAFAAIMLTGNRKQAAEALQVPRRNFYYRVDAWPTRGTDYKRLYRMIEWRKKSGRKIKVRLDDSLLGTDVDEAENPRTIRDVLENMRDKTDEKSRDELLRDILLAIASQNADNWQSVRAELIEILNEEVLQ